MDGILGIGEYEGGCEGGGDDDDGGGGEGNGKDGGKVK